MSSATSSLIAEKDFIVYLSMGVPVVTGIGVREHEADVRKVRTAAGLGKALAQSDDYVIICYNLTRLLYRFVWIALGSHPVPVPPRPRM